MGTRSCLFDVPSSTNILNGRCGNHVIEDEEECDCGPPQFCNRYIKVFSYFIEVRLRYN